MSGQTIVSEKMVQASLVQKTSLGMTGLEHVTTIAKKVNSSQFFKHDPITLDIVRDNTNFCTLKKWRLQTFLMKKVDTTNFCKEKSRHYQLLYSQKGDTTNFYSLKKGTLQTFVVSKRGHYQLLQSQKADTTDFCNEKSGHYKLL